VPSWKRLRSSQGHARDDDDDDASALSLKTRQMAELNACSNSAFRKSFGFQRWESVRQFIHGLGRLDLIHIFMLRKSKFMCKTYRGSNTLMHNLL